MTLMRQELQSEQRLLGRFQIGEVLGSGGFGTTYAGVDEETGQQVAIKQLDLSRVDDWKAVQLFEREARTLEQLSHEQIPAYIDFIPVEGQSSGYLIQALAPGRSLQAILDDRGVFTDQQVEGIAEQVLEVLVYLASLNPPVVHRDIKPANLLFDERNQIYLVDFGAVQDAATRSGTAGSTVAGTFGYLAPEQLHGEASPRSDLYGLGMTLIHLASGRPPTTLGRSGLKIDFRDAVDLPEPFKDFLDRLVEPNPDERFASPREALRFLRDQVPVTGNVSGLLDAKSMSALIEQRERRTRMARQERERRVQEESRAIESRVTIETTNDGHLVTLNPPMSRSTLGFLAFITFFLIINPGVFFAQPHFLGESWPIFNEPTQLHLLIRWSIYAIPILVIAGFLGVGLKPGTTSLQLTPDHFAITRDYSDQPVAFGEREQLTLSFTEDESGLHGTLFISVPGWGNSAEYEQKMERMPIKDLRAIQDLS